MPLNQETSNAKAGAQAALFNAITEAVAALQTNGGSAARTEGLKNLAEAYAWLIYPNQSHWPTAVQASTSSHFRAARRSP
ncbi:MULTISPECIES: hypothetical protein [unclassified Streptomyces]|uniref:hypothetical protein n=1 Tax=unclassified Streptomyces TaxID=2593676 RepID=UPI00131754CA|nr:MULTISPECIES: hypothetical protein [unclassified Streptomyces]QHC31994.1 hypothetical protein GR129_27545 [Streptomyces sp. HF10]WKE69024.1 hypothetical protein QHG49_08290 [Streptomyces sp. WP-1]